MISKEQKFIFIHNFKTGGTSIEKKLGHFETLKPDVQDHRTIREIKALTNRGFYFKKGLYALKLGKPRAFARNLSLSVFPELTASQFREFYKFSFVRNSWARVYSWYANVMKDDALRSAFGIQDPNLSYEDFLKGYMNHKTFSQLYFLSLENGQVPMDFIGRFEKLQEDFNTVCKQLDIEDADLPKLLVRKYGHYTENYTPKTKDLIYELYREEIDSFKFEFGE